MTRRVLLAILLLLVVLLGSSRVDTQGRVTSPKEEFGHDFGEDYFLANYKQISAYWNKLAKESPRITVHDIGKTAEGRSQLMAIVTSPENHASLAKYKDISRRLALAEGLTDAQARALAKEGKAVVWIDGGLHASESLGAQQLGEMVYQMVSRTDEETMRILNDVIMLFVHANPDGNDLVADWYMRAADPKARSLANLPKLYQKYIGHDNNRDFFASTQAETENINRVLYHEWFPQILYNHHQSGPAGTVLWSPPLRDPFNYNQDPLLVLGLQTVGIALQSRLAAEGKPGATSRSGGAYDGWWNGGIRNTAAFHNIIAILTEMIGSPTPMRVPLVMQRQLPNSDLPYPVPPQEWHFRTSIEYSIAANRGILDLASRTRENILFNIYRMGKNSIERGSRDTWTPAPRRYQALAAKMGSQPGTAERDMAFWAELHTPELRDPRGYIIPSTQPDFPTATKFINALRETGIAVQRATRDFDVAGKKYPAGSYVVLSAQAFRPHVIDMFEPQDHPDNFPYPARRRRRRTTTPAGRWRSRWASSSIASSSRSPGRSSRSRIGTSRRRPAKSRRCQRPPAMCSAIRCSTRSWRSIGCSSANEDVMWLQAPISATGRDRSGRHDVCDGAAVNAPADPADRVGPRGELRRDVGARARDRLENEEAAHRLVGSVRRLDRRGLDPLDPRTVRVHLRSRLCAGARRRQPQREVRRARVRRGRASLAAAPAQGGRGRGGQPPANLPPEYQGQVGRVTLDKTLPEIKRFLENGGTVVALGDSAANLASWLELPIENHLAEGGAPLPRTKFYTPGSVLQARVDTSHPIAHGMAERTDMFFENSPVFRLGSSAAARGVKAIAWFDTKTPLRSGWSWGQHYLEGGVAAIEAPVGKGQGPAVRP